MTCPPYYLILWDEYLIITLHIIANRIAKKVREMFVTDQFSVKFTSKKADKMGFLENQDGGWMMDDPAPINVIEHNTFSLTDIQCKSYM